MPKGDDQFPVQGPGFLGRGKGCHAWDPNGYEFIEYGMGLRAVTQGQAAHTGGLEGIVYAFFGFLRGLLGARGGERLFVAFWRNGKIA